MGQAALGLEVFGSALVSKQLVLPSNSDDLHAASMQYLKQNHNSFDLNYFAGSVVPTHASRI
jgi:hypothetical protein